MICEHFTIQTLKPLSVHEPTHQMQTYCERKKNYEAVPLKMEPSYSSQIAFLRQCIAANESLMKLTNKQSFRSIAKFLQTICAID